MPTSRLINSALRQADSNLGSHSKTIVIFSDGIILPSSTTLGKEVIEATESEQSNVDDGGGFSIPIIIPCMMM
jgi:hypothetical protein